jgi:aldose sugar dehydrogenase
MSLYISKRLLSPVLSFLTISVLIIPVYCIPISSSTTANNSSASLNPINPENAKAYQLNLTDPTLRSELVATGLKFPTSMAFLGPNDILVLEKDNGTVKRIINGQMLEKPFVDVNVYGLGENGLWGVAAANDTDRKDNNNVRNIFLFYSESKDKDTMEMEGNEEPLGNRLYRYKLANNSLIDPQLILDLPYSIIDSPMHNGGKILVGPDNNIYVVTGDLGDHYTESQNAKDGDPADGSSGVLVVQQNGEPILKNSGMDNGEGRESTGILGNENPLNLYYAYGIRNSFGMDFDPVTGNLWITENGPEHSDEINLVEPGFNGGYDVIQGLAKEQNGSIDDLVDFDGKGRYSDPEFVWEQPMGVTAIKFINSTKYGEEYRNDVLVGDFNYGNIFRFELNDDRETMALEGNLGDKKAESSEDMKETIFAQGPGGIVDIQIGPDGYVYILSLLATVSDCDPVLAGCVVTDSSPIEGVIHRIVPANN